MHRSVLFRQFNTFGNNPTWVNHLFIVQCQRVSLKHNYTKFKKKNLHFDYLL